MFSNNNVDCSTLDLSNDDPIIYDNIKSHKIDFISEIIETELEKIKNNISSLDINTDSPQETCINSKTISELLSISYPIIKSYSNKSQRWIGYIIEMSENKFTAKLYDKNNPTTYEIAQFDKEDISQGDLSLLKIGALFYWSIGYETYNGQKTKQSLIRFKRNTTISEEEFDNIMDNSYDLYNALKWE